MCIVPSRTAAVAIAKSIIDNAPRPGTRHCRRKPRAINHVLRSTVVLQEKLGNCASDIIIYYSPEDILETGAAKTLSATRDSIV